MGRVQLDAPSDERCSIFALEALPASSDFAIPFKAARLVLDKSPHVYFVGTGAERFATQHGMRLIDNTELIVPRERDPSHGLPA